MRDSASIVQPVAPPMIIANASWMDLIHNDKWGKKGTWRLTEKKRNGYMTTPL